MGKGRRPARRWLGRTAGALVVVLAVAAGAGYLRLRAYLHSEDFRGFLAGRAAALLDADAAFEPFRWDGLQVSSSGFEATGGRVVERLRADGLRTEVGLGGIRRGVWILRGAAVRRLEVAIGRRPAEGAEGEGAGGEAAAAAVAAERGVPAGPARGWLPRRVELEELRIDESVLGGRLAGGEWSARGQSWVVRPAAVPGVHEIEGRGGTLEHPLRWFPRPEIRRVRLRTSGRRIYLLDSEMQVYRNGLLDLSGEVSPDGGEFTFDGGAAGIGCDELVPEDWRKRLTGRVGTRFTVRGRGGRTSVTGRLAIRDGVLTALPVLDRLAAYADTARFRVLALDKARTDYAWRDGKLALTDVVVSSEGLMRLEGRLEVAGGRLDGAFRLGLAPGTLARIPGAETIVFAERSGGLMWAPVRITGTLDDPKEDLSERLIAAAGERMFEILPETGVKVLRFTRDAIGEGTTMLLENRGGAVDAGVDILREAGGVVRDVGGGLFGLLPGGEDKQPPERK